MKDLRTVLQNSVQKQWDEVMQAMNSFTYFNGLDEVARREGCKVAKMKAFDPNEIIMGDGAGVPNYVYFILSGNCQMIESLRISYSTVKGRTYYSLYDPYVPEKTEDIIDFETKYFKNRILRRPLENKPTPPQTPAGQDEDHKVKSTLNETDTTITDIEVLNGEGEDGEIAKDEKESEENQNEDSSSESSLESLIIDEKETNKSHAKENNLEDISDSKHLEVQDPKKSDETLPKNDSDPPHEIIIEIKSDSKDSKNERKQSVAVKVDTPDQPQKESPNLRTYFMQVCIFKPGSTFGFGENMRDRRIVAITRVDCMLLPKMWLLQRNTANIWSRVQRYLEKKIPTKKKLFKEFVQNRRWLEWRDSIVEDIAGRSRTVNHTTYHDVPYSIRMMETPDI